MPHQTIYAPIFQLNERVVRSNARPDSFRFRGIVESVIAPENLPEYLKQVKRLSEKELLKLGCTFTQFIKWLKERDRDAFKNYWYVVREPNENCLYICLESDLLKELEI